LGERLSWEKGGEKKKRKSREVQNGGFQFWGGGLKNNDIFDSLDEKRKRLLIPFIRQEKKGKQLGGGFRDGQKSNMRLGVSGLLPRMKGQQKKGGRFHL